jgi:hypothetical protein
MRLSFPGENDLAVAPREVNRSCSSRRQLLDFPEPGDRVALERNCADRYGSLVVGVHRVPKNVVVQLRLEYGNGQQVSAQGQRAWSRQRVPSRVQVVHACMPCGPQSPSGSESSDPHTARAARAVPSGAP